MLLLSCNCSLVLRPSTCTLPPLPLSLDYATVLSCKSLQDLSFGLCNAERGTGCKASHLAAENPSDASPHPANMSPQRTFFRHTDCTATGTLIISLCLTSGIMFFFQLIFIVFCGCFHPQADMIDSEIIL